MNPEGFEPAAMDRNIVERMSRGWKGRVARHALADKRTRDLVRDVLRLDPLEQSYLIELLKLDSLGWTLTKAGEDGPGGVPVWEAEGYGTRIEATSRSALLKMARVSG